MNTSIITSNSNSLPCELIIKLVYYLDEETITDFVTTCKFVKSFYFTKLLVPYKIVYKFDSEYYTQKNIVKWFYKNIKQMYHTYSVKYYLKDLIDAFDKINNVYITDRIKPVGNKMYSINDVNRHQCIRHPINRNRHQFRIDERPTDRRYIKTNLHCILNINRFTYSYLREKHFTVLGLIY